MIEIDYRWQGQGGKERGSLGEKKETWEKIKRAGRQRRLCFGSRSFVIEKQRTMMKYLSKFKNWVW